jgi:plastocyanin
MVAICRDQFAPAVLPVPIGATVTWTNEDTVTHRLDSEIFRSQVLPPGSSFSYTFNSSGTYDYICGIHPMIQGNIIDR